MILTLLLSYQCLFFVFMADSFSCSAALCVGNVVLSLYFPFPTELVSAPTLHPTSVLVNNDMVCLYTKLLVCLQVQVSYMCNLV